MFISADTTCPKYSISVIAKLAFIEVAIKFVLMKACEDKVKIPCMFFSCFCNYDDVIQVYKADFLDEVMQDSMHCFLLLKHTGGVGEPNGITVHWYKPSGVRNAVLGWKASLARIW